jgi:serine phosphatase RsbU (regulator of sigma subunit)
MNQTTLSNMDVMSLEQVLKAEIQKQRDEIEKQRKSLTDSIRYAGNIQKAILPSNEIFQRILPNSFVLFRPRDIVSGDFFWISKKEHRVVVVAGDCTGHGVPGAFMSILGITYLNEITSKDDIPPANRILNILREKIMKALHQTGDEFEQRDGMDLALYIVDYENRELQFSGANNPLYLIRKNSLIEYKGDRMPIGINATEEKSFKTNLIPLENNDSIYIFTDGYADQFGGPEGKKLKYRKFRQTLMNMQKLSVKGQKEKLWNEFLAWKGQHDQVDDVLIIGYRYKEMKL